MNERIKELESQAWEQVNRTNGLVRTEDFNQKFAELIVRECARIGELKEQGYSEYDSDISVGWYMRQHFRVEE